MIEWQYWYLQENAAESFGTEQVRQKYMDWKIYVYDVVPLDSNCA